MIVYVCGVQTPAPCVQLRLGEGEVELADLQWNPEQASMLAACLSDGSVALYDVSAGGSTLLASLKQVQASCCKSCLPFSKHRG